jgi:hypothetical protein
MQQALKPFCGEFAERAWAGPLVSQSNALNIKMYVRKRIRWRLMKAEARR